eukprot:TRINITY_DN12333_c0_g1_i1.p1 TRINITY_DN12333_c0_g1~~TRINITY_DN12333_c0_g1_i1.p1  ORF type:complete len:504 (-),score=132.01 TRINITY_DN12333_c0_g1_i1:88-1599(-)
MRLLKAFAGAILLLALNVKADQVILPPINGATGPDTAFVYITGAQIAPEAYSPMAQAVQKHAASGLRLWIAIPQFPGNFAVLGVDSTIAAIKTDLYNQGFPSNGTFFLGGHSLGSAQAQPHAVSNPNDYLAVILNSGPINRKYRTADSNLPVPTLTLTGEVDGLVRISRVAESVETQYWNPIDPSWTEKYPVILVPGINHMSFGSGTPPSAVKQRDLKLEVTEDQAHDLIGQYIAAYMQKIALGTSSSLLTNGISYTNNYVQPLIDALNLEGFVHFQGFCSEGQCGSGCYCGSPWVAQYAQSVMGGVDGATYDVQYAPSQTPSVLSASCASSSCSVSVQTSSSNAYALGDSLDTGFTQTAATEIAAKLVSRAEIQRNTVDSSASESNLDDAQSICAEINQAAYNWGLAHAGDTALARYKSLGQPFTFGADSVTTNLLIGREALWSASALSFTDTTDSNGNAVSQVVSPTMVTDSAGTHYCKLLSPARAMEWIYTDGLHKNDGI